jgi:hypothetical protein
MRPSLRVHFRFLTTDHWPLFSVGMGFAFAGEQVVGPGVAAFARGGRSGSGGSGGGAIPVGGGIGDSPNISVVVERYSDEKEFPVIAEGKAIRYAARSFSSAGQIVQQHGSFKGQSLRRAKSAALRAHYQSNTWRDKRMHSVETGYGDGDFHSYSGAAPRRLGCENFHVRYFAGLAVGVSISIV